MVDGLAARAFDFKVQRRSLAKQFAANSTPDFVALHFCVSLFRSCPRQRAVLLKKPVPSGLYAGGYRGCVPNHPWAVAGLQPVGWGALNHPPPLPSGKIARPKISA